MENHGKSQSKMDDWGYPLTSETFIMPSCGVGEPFWMGIYEVGLFENIGIQREILWENCGKLNDINIYIYVDK
jgi:hypothetical protein